MADLIEIPTHSDSRGNLSVIESILPFDIKRVYYIYDSVLPRGDHAHKYSSTFLVALTGKVSIKIANGSGSNMYELETPEKGLLLHPGDRINFECGEKAILLCLSSHLYDENDYII